MVCVKSDELGIGLGSEMLYVGGEHMAAQGWPIYQPNLPCALREVLGELSEPSKRTLAGNGVCVSQLGYVLLFALSTIKRVT